MGGTTHARVPAFKKWLATLLHSTNPPLFPSCPPLVIMLDADHAGKEARHLLTDVLPHAAHAFIPLWECRSKRATAYGCGVCGGDGSGDFTTISLNHHHHRRHPAGNPGVEHADPSSIVRSLTSALNKPWGHSCGGGGSGDGGDGSDGGGSGDAQNGTAGAESSAVEGVASTQYHQQQQTQEQQQQTQERQQQKQQQQQQHRYDSHTLEQLGLACAFTERNVDKV